MKKVLLSLVALSSFLYVSVGLALATSGSSLDWYADRGSWSSLSKTVVPSSELGLTRMTAASAANSSAAFVVYPGTGIRYPV